VQEHRYSVDIDGTPDEVWGVFWSRRSFRGPDGMGIEILHPGDDVGEGLVRHCWFHVPRYLLSGGKAESWEWLTKVDRPRSWKYDAVGKPLWSRAEGWTELEDLGGGRTRVHFRETYHAFNPVARALLEKRVHHFISGNNDKMIAAAVNEGVRRMRAARADRAATDPR
jgi:hypothetical protein